MSRAIVIKAVRHEQAGQKEVNLATGKTVKGGQFAPQQGSLLEVARDVPLTVTQEKQVETALKAGLATITKDGRKWAVQVKPAGTTRNKAIGTFPTLKAARQAILPALGVDGKTTKVKAYADVGEKIGGARKDIAVSLNRFKTTPTEAGLQELESLDPEAAARVTTKAQLWPVESLDEAQANSTNPFSAYTTQLLHSLVGAGPKSKEPEERKKYAAAVFFLKNRCDQSVADITSIPNALREIFNAREAVRYGGGRTWRGEQVPPATIYQKELYDWSEALGPRFVKFMKVQAVTVNGKNQNIQTVYDMIRHWHERKTPLSDQWAEVRYRLGADKTTTTTAAAKSKTPDQQDAAELRERLQAWERTRPTEYERVGGKPVEIRRPEEYIAKYGLRGVEFGNWMDDDSSRIHVDRCAEALDDLADVLGIPAKAVSLNKRLALAFGARGSGKAAAHYEPHKVVINLTKLGGAGAMAHEWGHFLDHIINKIDSGNPNLMQFASDVNNGNTETAKFVSQLMRAIQRGEGHVKYVASQYATGSLRWSTGDMYLRQHGNDPQKALDALCQQYKRTPEKNRKKWADYLCHVTGKKSIMLPTTSSNYYALMQKADSGKSSPYYSTPHEMFARAFEAYVEDKLAARKRKNSYLVNNGFTIKGADGQMVSPLPQGVERKRFNAIFDAMFKAIKAEKMLQKAVLQLI